MKFKISCQTIETNLKCFTYPINPYLGVDGKIPDYVGKNSYDNSNNTCQITFDSSESLNIEWVMGVSYETSCIFIYFNSIFSINMTKW